MAVMVIAYFLFAFIRKFLRQGGNIKNWLSGRSHRRGQQLSTAGLIAYTEGNWAKARRLLLKAATKSETPLLNYLMAARASNVLGEDKQAKELLRLAEQSTQGAEVAVGLTQAEMQLNSGSLEQALATLMRIRRNADKHPHILTLLKTVYLELKDWQSLLDLLPQLKKHQRITDQEFDQLQHKACAALLCYAGSVKNDSLQQVRDTWQQLPKAARRDNSLLAVYVGQLIKAGAEGEAEKILTESLRHDWHPALVELYGKVQGEDPSRQLLQAEAWLKERNNDAKLLLCLGRLSLRNQLWGKAREYFENSLKLDKQTETCAELARLLAHLGEHEQSNNYFQQGLYVSNHELIALPMPAERFNAERP
jgi:HemY protein